MYTFRRQRNGLYGIMRGEDHIGDIVKQDSNNTDKWTVETVGGSVLTSGQTLEDAKREVPNVLSDLETSFEGNK
jgi:hypothetical protein